MACPLSLVDWLIIYSYRHIASFFQLEHILTALLFPSPFSYFSSPPPSHHSLLPGNNTSLNDGSVDGLPPQAGQGLGVGNHPHQGGGGGALNKPSQGQGLGPGQQENEEDEKARKVRGSMIQPPPLFHHAVHHLPTPLYINQSINPLQHTIIPPPLPR